MPGTGWAKRGAAIIFVAMGTTVASTTLAPAANNALAPTTWERGADGQWHEVATPAGGNSKTQQAGSDPAGESRGGGPTSRAAAGAGAGAAAAATAAAPAATTTSPADGRILSSDANAAQDAELDAIEQLLADKRGRSAKKRIIEWIKANTTSPERDRGLFLLAEMYDQVGDKIRAYYHLDELMDFYPESRLFFPALEKQFGIADSFLKGYKRRFLGMPILTGEDEAIEMLFRIQERAPGSPIAERSLLRSADYYYDHGDYDFAVDAYAAYAKTYPRSPDTPGVRLRQAFASLAQFRGKRFDPTPAIDAKAQLQDIQAEYPELARREGVSDILIKIDEMLASRIAATADFYRRTHQPRAQAYNLRYLVDNYPDTQAAAKAKSALEKMPQWALDLPAPQSGRGDEESKLKQTGSDLRGGAKGTGTGTGTNTPAPPPRAPMPADRGNATPGLNDPANRQ
jgi:outer membrane assembly lipoprotein YfiO